jgi:outer membrane protein OmpA-like peptidoglycan-associated protein
MESERMVNPDRRPAPMARAALLLAALAPGCAVVPKSRLDDATKITQGLRAENAQLRDQTLALRGENRDLSERALGDARKITALEQGNERLEASVQGYIDEREDLVDRYQRFRRLAQASAGADLSAGLSTRLRAFASAHSGTTFDEASGALSAPSDALFAPGGDRLGPAGSRWVDDVAALLASPEAKAVPLAVTGRVADQAVRLASTTAPTGDLGLARALRVRDALAERSGRAPARIGVAGLGASPDPGPGRIEIRFGAAGH